MSPLVRHSGSKGEVIRVGISLERLCEDHNPVLSLLARLLILRPAASASFMTILYRARESKRVGKAPDPSKAAASLGRRNGRER
ncbi:MAG: hypothetical protein U0793_33320 [Gemmataceae bacterium]